MTATIYRFKFLPAELVVNILQDAPFKVAIEAAHSTGKPSVIKQVLGRIVNIKYGLLSPLLNLDHHTRKMQEIYINQFVIIDKDDFLEFKSELLIKTNFYIHRVNYNTLEKMYFAVLALLNHIQSRTYPVSDREEIKLMINNTKMRHHQIDLNLKSLFYRTVKLWLRPPNMMTEIVFYTSRQHGYIFPAKQY